MVSVPIVVLLLQLFLASPGQSGGSNIQVLSVSCERVSVPRPSDLEPPFSPERPPDSNPVNSGPRGMPVTAESRIEQRTSIDQRSKDMNSAEDKANRDRETGPPKQLYSYRIKLKNTGTLTTKFIIWHYESIDPAGTATSPARTFTCSANIKPDSTAALRATSHSPPDRVVSAKSSDNAPDQRGIIDRVEYDDGSVWQRPGWNLAESSQIIRPKTSRCLEVH